MRIESYLKCPGLEQALTIIPELFLCPDCGAEIEIWTDERKVRCGRCGKFAGREGGRKTEEAAPEKKPVGELKETEEQRGANSTKSGSFQGHGETMGGMELGVFEHTDACGSTLFYEKYEGEVELTGIEHGERYKLSCEVCLRFGKNLACPPHSPAFSEYLRTMEKARVICIRLPQDYFAHLAFEERYRACFRQARSLLTERLVKARVAGHRVAGSGPCLACEECALAAGSKQCEKPEKRIYSLESLGVNVVGLVKRCFQMDLDWSTDGQYADFVCAVGAVFY
jgi:predicted metal-binding protein